ncbi:unnamed protein product [Heterobilharzia americana]|nr:unnamed protein product [Heterobilharzia americana]
MYHYRLDVILSIYFSACSMNSVVQMYGRKSYQTLKTTKINLLVYVSFNYVYHLFLFIVYFCVIVCMNARVLFLSLNCMSKYVCGKVVNTCVLTFV